MEKGTFVFLQSSTDNRKNKQIHLTAAGEALAQQTVDRVFAMELSVFRQLSEEERALFVQLRQQYVGLLQREAENQLGPTE